MSAAYEEALPRLGLKDREDPLTEIVARRIIVEIAQRGIKNPSDICSLGLLELERDGTQPREAC